MIAPLCRLQLIFNCIFNPAFDLADSLIHLFNDTLPEFEHPTLKFSLRSSTRCQVNIFSSSLLHDSLLLPSTVLVELNELISNEYHAFLNTIDFDLKVYWIAAICVPCTKEAHALLAKVLIVTAMVEVVSAVILHRGGNT